MNIYIVIPAHNEEDSIGKTLDSLVKQSLLPARLVLVNDNSTDGTKDIVESYIERYSWISLVNTNSSDKHLPGAKIIDAFYEGLETLDEDFDMICKFDADLIFPEHYLETIVTHLMIISNWVWWQACAILKGMATGSSKALLVKIIFVEHSKPIEKLAFTTSEN